jgi:hypothetical protein
LGLGIGHARGVEGIKYWEVSPNIEIVLLRRFGCKEFVSPP